MVVMRCLALVVAVGCAAPAYADGAISEWGHLNDQCRSSGHSTDDAICTKRDELTDRLMKQGWSYGRPGKDETQAQWHRGSAGLTIPDYDVDGNCGQIDAGPGRNTCMANEQESYNLLQADWEYYRPLVVQRCEANVARSLTRYRYAALSECLNGLEEAYRERDKTKPQPAFQR